MEAKQVKGLMEAYASVYANISESHFKVGDEVVCKASGMEGEIVKVDPEGKGKYYTVKREDGKTMKYAPDELKLDKEEEGKEKEEKGEKEEEGASKEKESEFHDKLDKMVHKTFGKRPEEKKMKEEVELDEAGLPYGPVGRGFKKLPPGKKRKAMMDRADALRTQAMKDDGDGGKGSPRGKMGEINDALTNPRLREETDLFDYILEHLVAEGYADTNKAALAIMANMSEEWKQSILEVVTTTGEKAPKAVPSQAFPGRPYMGLNRPYQEPFINPSGERGPVDKSLFKGASKPVKTDTKTA